MMAQVYLCDRCDKRIDGEPFVVEHNTAASSIVVKYQRYHLCKTCNEGFEKFVKGK